jgi:oxygen-independent coproporphyrinogen-3 oxidase
VLATLDRRHTPGAAVAAARMARDAGFEHVSLDLIFGTPGEHDADWAASLDAAIGAGVDHVSAYALTVEPGTRLHAQVRRGAVAAPDEDAQARRYSQADAALGAAGLRWYEIANWATSAAAHCAHNAGYWRSDDWWGLGPGAHSHVGGVRWWNVLHPARYAERVAVGRSPAAARERLTEEQQRMEQVLLGVRLAAGLELRPAERVAAVPLAAAGLLDARALALGVALLTLDGRLMADHVARELLGPAQAEAAQGAAESRMVGRAGADGATIASTRSAASPSSRDHRATRERSAPSAASPSGAGSQIATER